MIDVTKLLVGVPVMDEQHASLVELYNVLETPGSDLEALWGAFGAYADFHFEEEESLMRQYAYPGTQGHVADHQAYRATFERMRSESAGGLGAAREAMLAYVAKWLADHILGVDKHFAEFLLAAGYAPRR